MNMNGLMVLGLVAHEQSCTFFVDNTMTLSQNVHPTVEGCGRHRRRKSDLPLLARLTGVSRWVWSATPAPAS